MALIKGSQLASVGKLFQLGQEANRSATDIDVENVTQVLGINEIVRRSNAAGAESTGLFIGLMENTHGAGATEEESTIDPYAATAALVSSGYPAVVSGLFDIWILSITGRRAGGTGTNFNDGQVNIDDPATQMGWTVDQAGVVVGGVSVRTIAKFTQLNEDLATSDPLLGVNGEIVFVVNERLRRGSTLSWGTSASNAVVIRAQILLGVFPAGLGQDVAT